MDKQIMIHRGQVPSLRSGIFDDTLWNLIISYQTNIILFVPLMQKLLFITGTLNVMLKNREKILLGVVKTQKWYFDKIIT